MTLICLASAAGQTLEVVAPAMVPLGKAFNVEYRIAGATGRLSQPRFEGFVQRANGMSSYNDSSVEGGKVVTRIVTSYTFVLVGQQVGVFMIPAVTLTTPDGKTYTSKPVPVEVVDEGEAGGQAPPATNGDGQQVAPPTAVSATEDVFLRAVVDRTSVWKGEPVRVYFKLYTRYTDIRNDGAKAPSLNGFWSEALDTGQYEVQTENYNSNVYYTQIISERLLFPLQSGTLTIDPMQMNLVILEMTGRQPRSIEEMMMGVGPEVTQRRKTVSSQPVTINVRELPSGAPTSFSGAVGEFTMTSEPPAAEVTANAGKSYTIRITGTGNLRQVVAPKVALPASFEVLNTKSSDEIRSSSGGMTGYREFEYPFIVRGEGSFRIEPVEFSFFDPKKGAYQVVTTPEARMEVLADTLSGTGAQGGGLVSGVTRRELEILNQDIRFIKNDAPELSPRGAVFIGSAAWYMALGLIVAAFVAAYIYLSRMLKARRNVEMMRGRRANKVVLSRLRAARQYMGEGNARRFHDEMLKALWGYMGDKLNIPAANLTRENVREQLTRREVPGELINKYIDLISESESAQYSPAGSAPMDAMYGAAADVISKIESYFK